MVKEIENLDETLIIKKKPDQIIKRVLKDDRASVT